MKPPGAGSRLKSSRTRPAGRVLLLRKGQKLLLLEGKHRLFSGFVGIRVETSNADRKEG